MRDEMSDGSVESEASPSAAFSGISWTTKLSSGNDLAKAMQALPVEPPT